MRPAVVAVAAFVVFCSAARADTLSLIKSDSSSDLHLDPMYLVDGGALPFFWGALAGTLIVEGTTTPRDTPILFPSSEGGLAKASWEVPGWAVTGLGVGLGAGIFASGDASRMYHIKGLAESLATAGLATDVLKTVVGRHRPDWSPTNDSPDERKSFPSGHSMQAFAVATYGILYLHDHVFDKEPGLSLTEGLTYAGIGLGAAAIAGERVVHARHHLSDVAAGAAVGTLSSTLFYLYQEHRYRDHRRTEQSWRISPSFVKGGATIGISGTF